MDQNTGIELLFPKRKPFSKEEDIRLIELEGNYRNTDRELKWQYISWQMPGRTPRQCKDRFVNYLNLNIMGTKWTKEEDILLLTKVSRMGKKWVNISRFFQNRTPNQLKNRYNSKEFKNNTSVFPENTNYTKTQKYMVEKANKAFSSQRTPIVSLNDETKENLLSYWENNKNIFGEDNYEEVFSNTEARRRYTEEEEAILVSLRNCNDNITFDSIDRITARQYSDCKFYNMKKADMEIQEEIDSLKGKTMDFE